MKIKSLPSQERLQYLFYYNPKIGKLYARFKSRQYPIGRFGALNNNGYLRTMVDRVHYVTHRLIWIYVNGTIPEGMVIDHIDGNKANNKIENLRVVSKRHNEQNRRTAKGYYFHKATGKWVATIKTEEKLLYLGSYDTKEEARSAYLEAKKIYHPSAPHYSH